MKSYITFTFPYSHAGGGLTWSSTDEFTGWMIRGSNSCRGGKRFLFSPKRPDRLWCTPILFSGYRVSFAWVKRTEREAVPSPSCSAKVQSLELYLCSSIHLHGVDRGKLRLLRISEILRVLRWWCYFICKMRDNNKFFLEIYFISLHAIGDLSIWTFIPHRSRDTLTI